MREDERMDAIERWMSDGWFEVEGGEKFFTVGSKEKGLVYELARWRQGRW
jgi:hypothetical protein